MALSDESSSHRALILGQEVDLPRADDTPAVFHYLAARLLEQNERSFDPVSELFRIRDATGNADPVGFLLPDNEYHADLEAWHGVDRWILAAPALEWAAGEGYNVTLLQWLVQMHDCDTPAEWTSSLAALAKRFRVAWTPPESTGESHGKEEGGS